jgi:hypothetical protein
MAIPAALAAFARSSLEGHASSGLSFTSIVHLHAALMALWLPMLIGQAWFISAKCYALHRRWDDRRLSSPQRASS